MCDQAGSPLSTLHYGSGVLGACTRSAIADCSEENLPTAHGGPLIAERRHARISPRYCRGGGSDEGAAPPSTGIGRPTSGPAVAALTSSWTGRLAHYRMVRYHRSVNAGGGLLIRTAAD